MANSSDRSQATLLVAVYAIFAISASARAGYQLLTKFEYAPLAYSLSAISAAVYLVATVSLAKSSSRARRVARVAVWFELVGVLAVGTLSLILPAAFQHPSVWSWFGLNYACLPLVLPIFALIWLKRTSASN